MLGLLTWQGCWGSSHLRDGQGCWGSSQPGDGQGCWGSSYPTDGQGCWGSLHPSDGQGCWGSSHPKAGIDGVPHTPGMGRDSGATCTPGMGTGAGAPCTPAMGRDGGVPHTPRMGRDAGAPHTPRTTLVQRLPRCLAGSVQVLYGLSLPLGPAWPLLAVRKPSSGLIHELRTWKSSLQASLEAWSCLKVERRGSVPAISAASPLPAGLWFWGAGITASRLGQLPWKILTSRQGTRASAKSGGAEPALTLLGSSSRIDLHRSGSVCHRMN